MKYTIEVHPFLDKFKNDLHPLIAEYIPKITQERYLEELKIVIDMVTQRQFNLNGGYWRVSTVPSIAEIRINFIEMPRIEDFLNKVEIGLSSLVK